ncbi:hypothetical protein SDC9_115764 [bioreactor metagenome]|uniref:Uncharacterized protein n=1 Tax=bioreactor metagenome TaxID=1076179 RepID=A0A645BTT2_9ZZZZ
MELQDHKGPKETMELQELGEQSRNALLSEQVFRRDGMQPMWITFVMVLMMI